MEIKSETITRYIIIAYLALLIPHISCRVIIKHGLNKRYNKLKISERNTIIKERGLRNDLDLLLSKIKDEEVIMGNVYDYFRRREVKK